MPARPLDQPSAIRAGRKNSRVKRPQPRAPWNWLCQATSAAPRGVTPQAARGGTPCQHVCVHAPIPAFPQRGKEEVTEPIALNRTRAARGQPLPIA